MEVRVEGFHKSYRVLVAAREVVDRSERNNNRKINKYKNQVYH